MEKTALFIQKIGCSVESLIETGLLNSEDIETPSLGDDTFSAIPEKGVSLVFDAASKILLSVQILLVDVIDNDENSIYHGALPEPFVNRQSKSAVRNLLGQPDKATDPVNVPLLGLIGGGDAWNHPLPEDYPGIRINTGYTGELKVMSIIFDATPSVC